MDSSDPLTPKPPSNPTTATATTTTSPPTNTTTTATDPTPTTTASTSTNRVYPTAPPPTNIATNPRPPIAVPSTTRTITTTTTTNPTTYQTTRTQQSNTNGPPYRPESQPYHRQRSRSHRSGLRRCCSCLLGTFLLIFTLLILIGITGVVLYFVYQPQFPTFTVTSLAITQFNLTPQFTTSLNLTLIARNPNKKIQLYYDPFSLSVFSGDTDVGDGSFPSYNQGTKNTTVLSTLAKSEGGSITGDEIQRLKSEIGSGDGLNLRVMMRTKVRLKIGDLRTVRFGIRVSCDGIRVLELKNGGFEVGISDGGGECKGKWRIKIWKLKLYI